MEGPSSLRGAVPERSPCEVDVEQHGWFVPAGDSVPVTRCHLLAGDVRVHRSESGSVRFEDRVMRDVVLRARRRPNGREVIGDRPRVAAGGPQAARAVGPTLASKRRGRGRRRS
jgi:hypothetical protein